jgi:hypothetical protein
MIKLIDRSSQRVGIPRKIMGVMLAALMLALVAALGWR